MIGSRSAHDGRALQATGVPPARRAASPALAAGALAALLALALAVAAAGNLGYRGMWWDESASFWGSQGLSRYAEPFASPGSLRAVVRMNRHENLDPGGFHVLLHLWTRAGTGLAWLRALPFAFFLLGSACIGLVGWRLSGSPVFAVAAAAAPLLTPNALYFGFEIRAYSMEAAGVAAGALALVLACERPSPARFLLLGATCAAFLTSRYSFAFAAAALALAASVAVLRPAGGRRAAAMRAAAVLIPALAAGAAVAVVTTAGQAWPEMRRGALGVAAPAYTRDSVVGASPRAGALLLRNLVSPAALPITAAALFLLLFRRRAYAAVARGRAGGAGPAAVGAVYVLVVGTQALSAAASLVGAYPWDIASRWSAYLETVAALAAVALAADAAALARLALPRRAGSVRVAAVAVAVVVVAAGSVRAMRHSQATAGDRRFDLSLQLDRLPVARLGAGSVFVTYYEVPVLRYMYEYGPYAGRPEYPGLFRFETVQEWTAAAPVDGGRAGIEYVVTALPPAEAQPRFPGVTLVRAGAGGGRLLRVVRPVPAGPAG